MPNPCKRGSASYTTGGVRGDGARPTAPDQVDGRIAEIEHLMRKTTSEYHRGPTAAAIQREYRDLIDERKRAKL